MTSPSKVDPATLLAELDAIAPSDAERLGDFYAMNQDVERRLNSGYLALQERWDAQPEHRDDPVYEQMLKTYEGLAELYDEMRHRWGRLSREQQDGIRVKVVMVMFDAE